MRKPKYQSEADFDADVLEDDTEDEMTAGLGAEFNPCDNKREMDLIAKMLPDIARKPEKQMVIHGQGGYMEVVERVTPKEVSLMELLEEVERSEDPYNFA